MKEATAHMERCNGAHVHSLSLSVKALACVRACVRACGGGREEEGEEARKVETRQTD
jgi:hypothetical protein